MIRQRFLPSVAVLLLLTVAAVQVRAAAPEPFHIRYDARYGNWMAESERRLSYDSQQQLYLMESVSSVELLGQSLTRITEQSRFGWSEADLPQPHGYSYRQSGIGSRKRSIDFDPQQGEVEFFVGDKRGKLQPQAPVYDDLSAFLVIRQQLEQGIRDIRFDVVDRDHIKSYRYQVLDTETITTALGRFRSVHLARIRDGDSERSTEFWLAPDHDYLLLKLVQEEPDGRKIRLDVTEASLSGQPLQALAD